MFRSRFARRNKVQSLKSFVSEALLSLSLARAKFDNENQRFSISLFTFHFSLRPQRSIWQLVSCLNLSISGSLYWHHCRYLRFNGLYIILKEILYQQYVHVKNYYSLSFFYTFTYQNRHIHYYHIHRSCREFNSWIRAKVSQTAKWRYFFVKFCLHKCCICCIFIV